MRILITTFGTRGDIQPFVALGKGLQAAGTKVVLCTPEGFKPFIEANGLDYAYVGNEFLELTEQALQAQGIRSEMAVGKQFPAAIRRAKDDEWRAAQALSFSSPSSSCHLKQDGHQTVTSGANAPTGPG